MPLGACVRRFHKPHKADIMLGRVICREGPTTGHSILIPAVLIIGHHFSISAF
jgi:hypothetical protein